MRLLVVEDEPSLREVVSLYLRRANYEVLAVADGQAALDALQAGPVSLVVPYDLAQMRGNWPAHLAQGTVVRFSTGLEDVADLQVDLEQAMRKALG